MTDTDPVAGNAGVKPIDAAAIPKCTSVITPMKFIRTKVLNNMPIGWTVSKQENNHRRQLKLVTGRAAHQCTILLVKLKRRIYWDPAKETFTNNDKEAIAMLSKLPEEKKI